MWQTAPLSSQVARVCVDFVKSQGKSKLAMLTDTKNAYAVSGHDSTKKILDQAGVQLIADETSFWSSRCCRTWARCQACRCALRPSSPTRFAR